MAAGAVACEKCGKVIKDDGHVKNGDCQQCSLCEACAAEYIAADCKDCKKREGA